MTVIPLVCLKYLDKLRSPLIQFLAICGRNEHIASDDMLRGNHKTEKSVFERCNKSVILS